MRHRVFELLLILKATRLSSIGAQMLLWTMLGILSTLGIMTAVTYSLLKNQSINEIQKTLTIEAQKLESDIQQVEGFANNFGVAIREIDRLLPIDQQNAQGDRVYQDLILEFLKQRPRLVDGLGIQKHLRHSQGNHHILSYTYYSAIKLNQQQATDHLELSAQTAPQQSANSVTNVAPFKVVKRLSPPYFSSHPAIAYNTINDRDRPSLLSARGTDSSTESMKSAKSKPTSQLVTKPRLFQWLEPYNWNQQVLVTLLTPVDNQTKTISQTIVDIDITDLGRRLNHSVIGDDGYFILLSNDGQVLGLSSNFDDLSQPVSYQQLTLRATWTKMQKSREGLHTTIGEFLAYRPIAGTDWMIVAIVPRQRLFTPLLQTALGTSLIASLVLLCSIWAFIYRLNQRLKPMIAGCQQLVYRSKSALLASGIAIAGAGDSVAQFSARSSTNIRQPEAESTENKDDANPLLIAERTLSYPEPTSYPTFASVTNSQSTQPKSDQKMAIAIPQKLPDPTFGLDELDMLQAAFQVMYQQLETSLGSLQETLNQLKDTQLQVIQSEKMATVGQMLAGVAHEINNPISFLSGNVEHLSYYVSDLNKIIRGYQNYCPDVPADFQEFLTDLDPDFLLEDLDKMVRSMRLGSERVREIVRSLRSFSRSGDSDFRIADLHEGLDSTLVILNHRLKASTERPEIQVMKDYGELPLVECCLGPLNQVFMNLLSNAIDAIEEAQAGWSFEEICHQPGVIRIQTRVIDARVIRILIADNGNGIPEQLKGQIFKSFVTSKPVGKGTGLGLSISYQVVHQTHQGRLWFDSQAGRGTAFHIEIPIHQETAATAQQSVAVSG
ncbi:MAG: sensor histidine kinase [Oscillatoriales cyanobacterium]|nr:MAG: sensor histidine kinase [Oscillatoriales cyanobacterium]